MSNQSKWKKKNHTTVNDFVKNFLQGFAKTNPVDLLSAAAPINN